MATETVAEAYLALLKARGVDILFANAGTDFPSIIEAYARQPKSGLDFPRPVIVPHENAAVAMAHGYYLATGRPQAVMVHVNVGLANSLCALLNAARENVPMLFTAGRTPITEAGHAASRDVSIHWGQEMFDQAGMLREAVKWDYELRRPDQLETVVDRALSIAMSDPAGPVYLELPREVLADPHAGFAVGSMAPAARVGAPRAADVEAAAAMIEAAEAPLIVTSRAGRDRAAFHALSDFAAAAAIPVVEYRSNHASLPSDHAMHAGFDVSGRIEAADLVLVLDTPAPWLPSRHQTRADLKVIHIGPDPLFADLPIRGFPADLVIAAPVAETLQALSAARDWKQAGGVERRRAAFEGRQRPRFDATPARLTADWVSHCLSEAKEGDAMVFNEIGCDRAAMDFTQPDSFFGPSNAGGLGWGLPAALGAKLAAPERQVIACAGDGSYMFANPVACHQAAAAHGIAILTVVFNNRMWKAVKTAAASVYPGGHARSANQVPMTALEPSPRFDEIAAACGGKGYLVDDPGRVPDTIAKALEEVASGTGVTLNVLIEE